MNERQIPRWAMAALALVVLFGLGSLLYNSGYSSGMVTGLLVSGSEGGAMNPYLLSRMGGMHGGFGFFGFFLRIGFFLVFLAVIGKVFGFIRWKRHMHHNGEGEGHHFHGPWNGPWNGSRDWRHWEQPTESAQPAQTATAQPAAPAATPAPATPPQPPVDAK